MYKFKLTEELARWTFEVACKENKDWFIAFTNPTAGPWKTIKGLDSDGNEGEVYRFELEETRPDIVIVNDKLRLVLIIEAKDSLSKLVKREQVEKSVEVVDQLTRLLRSKRNNRFWGDRAGYRMITGLLWGNKSSSDEMLIRDAYDMYYREMCKYKLDSSFIFGVETLQSGNDLECRYSGKIYENEQASKEMLARIVNSFKASAPCPHKQYTDCY